jgi:hypothetical protein
MLLHYTNNYMFVEFIHLNSFVCDFQYIFIFRASDTGLSKYNLSSSSFLTSHSRARSMEAFINLLGGMTECTNPFL